MPVAAAKAKPSPDWNEHDEFFNYTRARFLRNEKHELSQRRVRFNMNELARLAALAVGSQSCVDVQKYPDGLYSKAFLMTMDDGVQVVAKVPNLNAGLEHFTTASEVATMDFVRNICGTPAPKVFAWCSRANESLVGAEYIIMEKVAGIPLSSVWRSLAIDRKTEIVKTLAAYQKRWMSTTLKQFGSLYYAKDVPKCHGQGVLSYLDKDNVEVVDQKFAIGPAVHRQTIDYGRAAVKFDRGPWNTLQEHCNAIGQREIACVKSIRPLPKPPLTLAGRYIPTREKKLAALQLYLQLIEYVLPTDPSVATSHVWHTDLHSENIFVNPDKPTEITGIIDWQSAALVPLYENASEPAILDYDGPPLNGLERPEEPRDMEGQDEAQRSAILDQYMDMTLASYYRHLIYHTNDRLYRAMEFRETISYDLLSPARNILIDGEAVYCDRVADDLQEAWATLPRVQASGNPPFPFKLTEEERETILRDYENMSAGIVCMTQIQSEMGNLCPSDGCVDREKYDEAKKLLAAYKDKVLAEFARNEDERAAVIEWWPFE